jgi:FMN phosphatase YigB (HAD superfamily)
LYLIFDLDDTLLDTSATAGRFKLLEVVELWRQAGVLAQSPQEAAQELMALRRGFPTARDALKQYAHTHGLSADALLAAESEYYERLHPAVPIRLMEGALPCLDQLRLHHRLALVSIGRPEQQHRKMEAAGLDPARFDHIRIVEEGSKQRPFKELAVAWGFDPSQPMPELVAIGDRYATDIQPAQALGMRSIMVGDQPAELEPDARIASLDELAPILARWSRERYGDH